MVCNTAIFYDVENLIALLPGKPGSWLQLDEIYQKVLALENVNGVSVQRAYADWAGPQSRGLRPSVLEVGVEPIQVFTTNSFDKVKNAADVSLIIDAVDLVSKRPEIENYVIASGDGIFAFLARKLHEYGKFVIGASFESITSNIFRNACNDFIYLVGNGTEAQKKEAARHRQAHHAPAAAPAPAPQPPPQPAPAQAPAAPKPAPVQEAPKKPAHKPPKFPKSKYSDALLESGIPVLKDASDQSACFHTARRMLEALHVESTRDLPPLKASVFMDYLSYYAPDFRLKNFGFRQLSVFVNLLTTNSPFCIAYEQKNVLLICPRETAKGTVLEDIKGLEVTTESGATCDSVFKVPYPESFTYRIEKPESKPEKPDEPRKAAKPEKAEKPGETAGPPPPPAKKPLPEKPQAKAKPAPAPLVVEGGFRPWIKTRFEQLSKTDGLRKSEISLLLEADYSKEALGVRHPVLKEVHHKAGPATIESMRLADGKPKYWKETFEFGGRSYLVYKEWFEHLHQKKFMSWLTGILK